MTSYPSLTLKIMGPGKEVNIIDEEVRIVCLRVLKMQRGIIIKKNVRERDRGNRNE